MECPDTPWGEVLDHRIKRKKVANPSHAALFFLEFLKSNGIVKGRMADIGCGEGRNAVLFAGKGYEVHAIDHSDAVLKDLDLHGIKAHCYSVTDYWLFENDYFDMAMDILCYSGQKDKGLYISELRRVLKGGGYILLSVPADYTEEKIKKEFSGFDIITSKKSEDILFGKKISVLNVILKLKS